MLVFKTENSQSLGSDSAGQLRYALRVMLLLKWNYFKHSTKLLELSHSNKLTTVLFSNK